MKEWEKSTLKFITDKLSQWCQSCRLSCHHNWKFSFYFYILIHVVDTEQLPSYDSLVSAAATNSESSASGWLVITFHYMMLYTLKVPECDSFASVRRHSLFWMSMLIVKLCIPCLLLSKDQTCLPWKFDFQCHFEIWSRSRRSLGFIILWLLTLLFTKNGKSSDISVFGEHYFFTVRMTDDGLQLDVTVCWAVCRMISIWCDLQGVMSDFPPVAATQSLPAGNVTINFEPSENTVSLLYTPPCLTSSDGSPSVCNTDASQPTATSGSYRTVPVSEPDLSKVPERSALKGGKTRLLKEKRQDKNVLLPSPTLHDGANTVVVPAHPASIQFSSTTVIPRVRPKTAPKPRTGP